MEGHKCYKMYERSKVWLRLQRVRGSGYLPLWPQSSRSVRNMEMSLGPNLANDHTELPCSAFPLVILRASTYVSVLTLTGCWLINSLGGYRLVRFIHSLTFLQCNKISIFCKQRRGDRSHRQASPPTIISFLHSRILMGH